MKREIFGTIFIVIGVFFGMFNTIKETRENHNKQNYVPTQYDKITSQDLIFADEFNGKLNKNWDVQDNKSKYNRISMNEKENIEFEDKSALKLVTKKEDDNSITTPYLTVDKDDNGNYFNYGYYEAKLKFTNNNQIDDNESLFPGTNILKPWGAFWLYPIANATNEATEIDIVENAVASIASASVHELDDYEVIPKSKASSWFKGNDYHVNPLEYHRYGVYIEPNQYPDAATYTFYLDGKEVKEVVSKHPMGNQTMHLSMEIATEDYQDKLQGKPIKDLKTMKDEMMYVDYVHVYGYNS